MVRIEVSDREKLEEWFTEGIKKKDGTVEKQGVLDFVWGRIRFLKSGERHGKVQGTRAFFDRTTEARLKGQREKYQQEPEDSIVKKFVSDFLANRQQVKRYLLASPEDISESYTTLNFSKKEKELLKFIFLYTRWSDKSEADYFFGPYDLTKELGVDVCPYCNRQYVNTILSNGGEGIVRPQIDHFYPKSTYPQFALCLYNLIPVCANCNQRKSSKYEEMTNPYIQGIHEDAAFSVEFDLKSNEWGYQVSLKGGADAEKHIKALKLEELYKTAHQDHLDELIEKTDENSSYYYAHLENLLQGEGLSIDRKEFYRFYFGNYPDPKDFHKRPLAKFTHDILKELGVDLF